MREFIEDFWVPGVCVLAIVGLIAGMVYMDHRSKVAFLERCSASGFTAAQCSILAEVKASGDQAALIGGVALGVAAGRR